MVVYVPAQYAVVVAAVVDSWSDSPTVLLKIIVFPSLSATTLPCEWVLLAGRRSHHCSGIGMYC